MRNELFNPKHARLIVPFVLVLVAYTGFFALPQQTQFRLTSDSVHHRGIAIEKLLQYQKISTSESTVTPIALGKSATDRLNPITDLDAGVLHDGETGSAARPSPQSAVKTFAKIVYIFQRHGVICAAIEPESLESNRSLRFQTKHHVSLTGSFHDVLAAFESIEKNVPHASALLLSMNRSDQAEPCRWESEFCFMDELP